MNWYRIGLASIVTLVWVLDFVNATYLTKGAQVHDGLTGLMVIVLGWAFGSGVRDTIKQKLTGGDDAP